MNNVALYLVVTFPNRLSGARPKNLNAKGIECTESKLTSR